MSTTSVSATGKKLIQERSRPSLDGYFMIIVGLLFVAGGAYSFIDLVGSGQPSLLAVLARLAIVALGIFLLTGLYMLQPNEAALLSLFGQYKGTDRSEGLRWVNPLYAKRKLSLRSVPLY